MTPHPTAAPAAASAAAPPKSISILLLVFLFALLALFSAAHASPAFAQVEDDTMKEEPSGSEDTGEDDRICGEFGCTKDPTPSGDGEDDTKGTGAMNPDENGSEEGDGRDDDGDGETTDDDGSMGTENEATEGGSCDILGIDVCAPAKWAIKGILDAAWQWVVGITESLADAVMQTAFTLPSMDGELLDKYDAMVDTVKPGIIVGVLFVSLGMMLAPANRGTQHALLSGLPKVFLVGAALAFFPEFVTMMTDITGGLGGEFGAQAEVGKAFGDILADAAFFATAATIFSGMNPGIGAIVMGVVLLPLLFLLILVWAVGIVVDFLFAVLVMLGPVCLICWPMPGLQTITVVWFRALMACFLIPLIFSVEAAVGSWIVGAPSILTNSGQSGEDWAPALASIVLIVLILIMAATPKMVLNWAFGGAMGGSFSFKGAKHAVRDYTRDLMKSAAQAYAPGSKTAGAALGAAGGGRSGGGADAFRNGFAGAAGAATGAALGAAARNVKNPFGSRANPASDIGAAQNRDRGMRDRNEDPLKKAQEAMKGEAKPPANAGERANVGLRQGLRGESPLASPDKEKAEMPAAAPENAKATSRDGAPAAREAATAAVEEAMAQDQAAHDESSLAGDGTASDVAGTAADTAAVEESSLAAAESGMPTPDASAPVEAPAEAPAAVPDGSGYREQLAATGHSDAAIGSLAGSAAHFAQGAKEDRYERDHAQAMADGTARADQQLAQAQTMRQNAQDLPGIYNNERGELLASAEAMEAQANTSRAQLPQEAHRIAAGGAAEAYSVAMGQFAGEAAEQAATARADAAMSVAADYADARHHEAVEQLQGAEAALTAATTPGVIAPGQPNSTPEDIAGLEHQVEQGQRAVAAWAPGGAARRDHLQSQATEAKKAEYDRFYEGISGNHASRGARSPGYDYNPPQGPPRFPTSGVPSSSSQPSGEHPLLGPESSRPRFKTSRPRTR